MAIDVKCPKCGSELEAPDSAAGKKVKCPDCGTAIGVAGSEGERPARTAEREAIADRPGRRSAADDRENDRPRRRPRDEEDDQDDRPRRRRRRNDDDGLSTLIPYKNGKALAAYYCGVFALIPCLGLILGPIALILGILGLGYVKKRPEAHGTGHAWAGIILGSLATLGNLAVIGFIVISGAIRR